MCGVSALISQNEAEKVDFVNHSLTILEHRGPDDSGYFQDGLLALVHRRLSILELTKAGSQPMESACGKYVMIFNGEIYNHQELRIKYLKNFNFKGSSDSETILELFVQLKEKMIPELLGMWAIIIYDKPNGSLFVSRDRFGQKPLFHTKKGYNLAFSSELKALFKPDEELVPDPTSMVEYLATGTYGHLGVQTFIKDYYHFPPASYAFISVEKLEINPIKYWELPNLKESKKLPVGRAELEHVKNLTVQAVLSQTLSDVPIGLTLSGGIDSSIVAGILAKHYKGSLEVFSAITPGSNFDENKYIQEVFKEINRKDWNLNLFDLNKQDFKKDLERAIYFQEEPFGDPSILAHAKLMEFAASKKIKVVLNGQGADELFMGYGHEATAIFIQQFKRKPLKALKGMKEIGWKKSDYLKWGLAFIAPKLEIQLRAKARKERWKYLPSTYTKQFDSSLAPLVPQGDVYKVRNESMYGVHLPHLLLYDDRNAMSYSVEGRTPFLDHRLWEYLATLKTEYYTDNGKRKNILREACKEYLPEMVYNRKDKIGFFTPLSAWLNQNLNDVKTICKENLDGEHFNQVLPLFETDFINMPPDSEKPRLIWRAFCSALFLRFLKGKGK